MMSDKDDIWSYLTHQSTIDTDLHVTETEGWCTGLDGRLPTSFESYLRLMKVFSTKCQFIIIGKVKDYRDKHPELKPWRNGYICFYSLNFAFEAKNIELIVALRQLLQVPPVTLLTPHIAKYAGSRKEASDDMDRYFKQYNDHVTIKGVHFVILYQHDIPYVRQFFRTTNINWIDHHYEKWEMTRPQDLVSDDEI
jgi:hypothetical protein